ncbi:hypothetical protein Plhal304r1_c061g0148081 [Plasmopara halstedii]
MNIHIPTKWQSEFRTTVPTCLVINGFTSWQKRYTVEDIALSARRNVMQKQQSNAKALRDNSIFNVAD